MEINRTTLNSLTTVYSNSYYRSNSINSNPNPEINYLYNNVCGLAFSIDCSKKHLIIPMFCRPFIDDAIYNILNGESVDECIVGLYANGRPSDKRTANAIFKYFNNTPSLPLNFVSICMISSNYTSMRGANGRNKDSEWLQ